MVYSVQTSGTCSRQIIFDLDENGVVQEVQFIGGCSGNTQGVARLAKGHKATELIEMLKGVDCGGKGTSCPDQFARGLELALQKEASGN